MKRCLYLLMSTVLIGVMFFGCEPADEFILENDVSLDAAVTDEEGIYTGLPAYFIEELHNYQSVEINDDSYRVELTARVVGGTEENPTTTTFHYKVTGLGVNPALDSFYLEIPDCASLLSYTPLQSAKVEENIVKWNSSVTRDESRNYSMTFEGDVPLGIINTIVTRGSQVEEKAVLGPCQGVYTLSGSVFIDSNEDGTKQSAESGISSTVTLVNKTTNKEYEIDTFGNGTYSLMVLEGDYEISVNRDLLGDGYYLSTGKTSVSLNVTENISGLNFAFQAYSSEMVSDLEEGNLLVNTEPTKYWINQVRHAGKRNSEFKSMAELNRLLVRVEDRGLFDFGTDKQQNVLDILTRPIKADLDLYLQQLLTAELNILSGKGAIIIKEGQPELLTKFNDALLIYAEAIACYVICNDSQTQSLSTQEVTIMAAGSLDSSVLLAFNGSGGLGGR